MDYRLERTSCVGLLCKGARFASLASHVDAAMSRIADGDVAASQTEYKAFNDGWRDLRFGIRAQSRATAESIEDAMPDVDAALAPEIVDPRLGADGPSDLTRPG